MATIEGNIKKNLEQIIELLNSDSNEIQYKTIGTNKIFYGSPGTGKSFHIENRILRGVDEQYIFRTTFHPDSDYASFVGSYKPVQIYKAPVLNDLSEAKELYKSMKDGEPRPFHRFVAQYYKALEAFNRQDVRTMFIECGVSETTFDAEYYKATSVAKHLEKLYHYGSEITYQFEPQVFINAYIKAWENPDEHVYLVIEEINRGNCAQIFGDTFQLLDRKKGISEYAIKADTAITIYLRQHLKKEAQKGIENGKLRLPSNLSIIATMNTSDQSLFPMDSAFKRRWEWHYIPTTPPRGHEKDINLYFEEDTKAIDGTIIKTGEYNYKWTEFLKSINKRIQEVTHSDDKQLGYWFVKTIDGKEEISVEAFVSKVVFYLWNDVFKDYGAREQNPFAIKIEGKYETMSFNSFFEINSEGQVVENIGVVHTFMKNLGIEPKLSHEIEQQIKDSITSDSN